MYDREVLRKESHKQVERRRRETINSAIEDLGKLIPEAPETNKGSILTRSVDFMRTLKQENEKLALERMLMEQAIHELTVEVESLRSKNRDLKRRLVDAGQEVEEEEEEGEGEVGVENEMDERRAQHDKQQQLQHQQHLHAFPVPQNTDNRATITNEDVGDATEDREEDDDDIGFLVEHEGGAESEDVGEYDDEAAANGRKRLRTE